jgi:DNA-binding NtrC family response regulator
VINFSVITNKTEIIFIDDDATVIGCYQMYAEIYINGNSIKYYFQDSVEAYNHLLHTNNQIIVVSDMKMAHYDGLDIIRMLIEKKKKLKGFFLVTGNPPDELINNSNVKIITKPLDLTMLTDEILDCLEAK